MVADQHQRALLIIEIDAARRVGEDDRANSHASEHAHREGDFVRRISFIKMYAALHHGDRERARLPDYQLSSMSDCSGSRKRRNIGVRDACCVCERVSKAAETGAENKTDARLEQGLSKDELCGGFS